MKRLGLALFASAALAFAPACTGHVHGRAIYVVDVAPPLPRAVIVTPRPGFVWIAGYWEWYGSSWRWRTGHWVRERPGQVWVPGSWVHVGARWHWQPGRWNAERAQVRDHRTAPRHEPRPARPQPKPRPKTRDHR